MFVSCRETEESSIQTKLNDRYCKMSFEDLLTRLGPPSSYETDSIGSIVVTKLHYSDSLALAAYVDARAATETKSPYMDIYLNKDNICISVRSNMAYIGSVINERAILICVLLIIMITIVVYSARVRKLKKNTTWKLEKFEKELKDLKEKIKKIHMQITYLDDVKSSVSKLSKKMDSFESELAALTKKPTESIEPPVSLEEKTPEEIKAILDKDTREYELPEVCYKFETVGKLVSYAKFKRLKNIGPASMQKISEIIGLPLMTDFSDYGYPIWDNKKRSL